tara:strand:+ start:855 stop:1046 length:192 start_codon:yes stop_codon:yes gene_type:complete
MKDPNFYKTPMGKKYYEHDLPRLIESQNRLAAAIEKQNKLFEKDQRKSITKDEIKKLIESYNK